MTDAFETAPVTKPFQYFFHIVDVIALETAYYLAYLTVTLVPPLLFKDEPSASFGEVTFSAALLIPLVWLVVLEVRGLYGDPARLAYSQILIRLLQTTFLGLGIVALILFAVKQGGLSRLLFFIFGIYSFLILVAVRLIEKWYFVQRHRAGHYSEKLVVVGRADDAQTVQRVIAGGDTLRDYEVIGYFDACPTAAVTPSSVPYLGKIESLKREITKRQVNEALVVWDSQRTPELNGVMDSCREVGARIRVVPKFALEYGVTALSTVSAQAESFWGMPSIVLSTVKWQPEQEFLKRLIDIFASATLLITLSPILLIIALAVKLSSPGPILYRWKVLGKNNREFMSYKFRTMVANADELKATLLDRNEMQGPVFKMKSDPRITKLGRFLRKYSLDELPQFWSVLVGDMSLVGPRPPSRAEFERFEFWQMRKLSVRPGITCLWQVSGRNKISDFNEWVKLDLEYIDNWSLWLDLKILIQTIFVVIAGTGV